MDDDGRNYEYVEMQADDAHKAEMRLIDIEVRIKALESRLESLTRKVYDVPHNVRIIFQDETGTPIDYGAGSPVYLNDNDQLVYEDGSQVLNHGEPKQERTLENIGDEIDAATSEFMDMVEAGEHD